MYVVFSSQLFYLCLFSPFLAGFILPHMPAFSAASKQSLILTLVIFSVSLSQGRSPNFLLLLLLLTPLHNLLIDSWFSLKRQDMLELS